MSEQEQPLVFHLLELRNRLLHCIIAIGAAFLILSVFANDLYQLIAMPLIDQLPENSSMIATEVAAPFLAPFKLSFFLAIFLAMPYLLYQAWSFVAPGLYDNERKFAIPLMVSSIVLFYFGVAFAFFVVFPLLFAFLTATAPEGVTIMTDISRYLDFILKLFFAFGLAFEVPVLTVLLIRSGITSADSLREKRPYIIISAFVAGMLLTPPDVISQILLALPIWLLFEVGLLVACKYTNGNAEENNA